jgi:hypothetical protein
VFFILGSGYAVCIYILHPQKSTLYIYLSSALIVARGTSSYAVCAMLCAVSLLWLCFAPEPEPEPSESDSSALRRQRWQRGAASAEREARGRARGRASERQSRQSQAVSLCCAGGAGGRKAQKILRDDEARCVVSTAACCAGCACACCAACELPSAALARMCA